MQQQGIDLSGLKDIHLPPMPPAWPPSARFWIVLGSLAVLVFLVRWIIIRSRIVTARKYANREVESITKRFNKNGYKIASELSLLMRRIALMKFPREEVSPLSGKEWRRFLEKTSKKPVFEGRAGDIIENIMYIPPERFGKQDVAPLVAAAKEWIAEHT